MIQSNIDKEILNKVINELRRPKVGYFEFYSSFKGLKIKEKKLFYDWALSVPISQLKQLIDNNIFNDEKIENYKQKCLDNFISHIKNNKKYMDQKEKREAEVKRRQRELIKNKKAEQSELNKQFKSLGLTTEQKQILKKMIGIK